MIISWDNQKKAIFDIFVLLLVGYSCVMTMYIVSFSPKQENDVLNIIEKVVEQIFVLDLLLNFITSYKDVETQIVHMELKAIAKNYIFHGWFFVDFVSVFPFNVFLPTGQVTKLLRLARLPRLIKMIDISQFQKAIQTLTTNQSRDEQILAQYMILYVYKIFRLIIIAIIITYFIGCFWFLFCSIQFNNLKEIYKRDDTGQFINEMGETINTFINEFGLEDEAPSKQLVISCYYALTTLSTVGYGDYFPISNSERFFAVIIMLGGVAFFSYIMGNFIEIISNYEKKMGNPDQSGDLNNWMILLTRFTNNQPLSKNLTTEIEANFSYYWDKDRVACLSSQEEYLESLPKKLKTQIMTSYLFSDIFKKFKKFFQVGSVKETKFLYDIAFGFMPRKFEHLDDQDKILYDEEEDVTEMYFIIEGIVGVGFNLMSNGIKNKSLIISKELKGEKNQTIVADHYVVNQCKSQFTYIAFQKDIHAFALTKKFVHENVFPEHPELMAKIQTESFRLYKKLIFKPVNESRKAELAKQN